MREIRIYHSLPHIHDDKGVAEDISASRDGCIARCCDLDRLSDTYRHKYAHSEGGLRKDGDIHLRK